MKRLVCLIFVVLLLVSIVTGCTVSENGKGYSETVNYSVEEVIDMCYTPPDKYEVRYRTYFSNGIVVDKWTTVSKEEYERIKEGS